MLIRHGCGFRKHAGWYTLALALWSRPGAPCSVTEPMPESREGPSRRWYGRGLSQPHVTIHVPRPCSCSHRPHGDCKHLANSLAAVPWGVQANVPTRQATHTASADDPGIQYQGSSSSSFTQRTAMRAAIGGSLALLRPLHCHTGAAASAGVAVAAAARHPTAATQLFATAGQQSLLLAAALFRDLQCSSAAWAPAGGPPGEVQCGAGQSAPAPGGEHAGQPEEPVERHTVAIAPGTSFRISSTCSAVAVQHVAGWADTATMEVWTACLLACLLP